MPIVGDRIDVNGDRGTVLYVGPLDGYDGEWIGIDWDDEGRGKHDGFVGGKRYFHASSAKSGSFVRPRAVSTGRNLLEEMSERYNECIQCHTVGFETKNMQLVNMAKSYRKENNLWELRIVVVDNMKVARAPPRNCSPFPCCTELILYNNLLSRWCDLLDILYFFPALRCLTASRNRMEKRMKSVIDKRKVSAPISVLALGECRIDESTANRIMHFFPHVREIHLNRNGLKYFDPGENGHCLESIDLEGNPVDSFTRLHVLSTLPNLRNLNLANCSLRHIEMPIPVGFNSLSSLNIKENPVQNKEWTSEVAKLPVLEKLCHSGNEIDSVMLIAKIPRLKLMGNSVINSVERHSAEIYFLNKFGVPPVAEENRAAIEKLTKAYGEPTNMSLVTHCGIGLLKLKLSYEGKVVERSLPETVTVQRLIGIVSRLFHLNSRKISLQAYSDHGLVVDLDKPLRSLNFYSLSNADTIYVKII